MVEKGIFTTRDIARKVHLMHILNIMTTVITDFFNRNEKTITLLNDYGFDFYDKDEIVSKLEKTADFVLKLKLKPKSMWLNKSNSFSLIIALAKISEQLVNIDSSKFKENLDNFEINIPSDYKLAATEGVNNKKERELRNSYLIVIIEQSK